MSGVQIWTAHLESFSPSEIAELEALLDGAEQTRAARFHFARDRRHYVASRGLLRRLLGAALEQPAAGLIFEYGAHGKPALAAESSPDRTLGFNLAHSAGWAMLALAWSRDIGIDLESARRLRRDSKALPDLAARVLSPRELEVWRTLPNDDARDAAFLRAWTRKEAYVKATGQGLFDELANIEVALDAAAPEASLTLRSIPQEAGATRLWTVHDLAAPAGFAAALAVEEKTEAPA